jgi:hypothetical protein
MSNKLSYSQLNRYLKCGYSHYLHYKERLRPNTTSAALLWGSAIDTALNSLLLRDGKDPLEVFEKEWENGFINGKKISLPLSTQIVYAARDYDSEVLEESDLFKMKQAMEELGIEGTDPLEAYEQVAVYKKQAAFRQFKESEFKYLNYCNWLSLRRKAGYILKAYEDKVMPRIKKVIAVQKTIELLNDQGDAVTGVIDLIAEMDDGNTYVLDNKSTSSMSYYEEDCVRTSSQLSLYALHEQLPKAGFIVYLKNLKRNKTKVCSKCDNSEYSRAKTCDANVNGKRCHGEWNEKTNLEAEINIILDDINPKVEEMVLDNFNVVNEMIKKEVFFKNPSSCTDYYGGKCPYFNYCHKGKTDDLEKV